MIQKEITHQCSWFVKCKEKLGQSKTITIKRWPLMNRTRQRKVNQCSSFHGIDFRWIEHDSSERQHTHHHGKSKQGQLCTCNIEKEITHNGSWFLEREKKLGQSGAITVKSWPLNCTYESEQANPELTSLLRCRQPRRAWRQPRATRASSSSWREGETWNKSEKEVKKGNVAVAFSVWDAKVFSHTMLGSSRYCGTPEVFIRNEDASK